MDKELEEVFECLKVLEDCASVCGDYSHRVEPIRQALLELKTIKEANPSEALEFVDKMANYILLDDEYGFIDGEEKQAIIKDRDTIKQALITKSKKELAWDIAVKKNVSLYWLKQSRNAKEYNIYIEGFRDTFPITEEEFDLIKRWVK